MIIHILKTEAESLASLTTFRIQLPSLVTERAIVSGDMIYNM